VVAITSLLLSGRTDGRFSGARAAHPKNTSCSEVGFAAWFAELPDGPTRAAPGVRGAGVEEQSRQDHAVHVRDAVMAASPLRRLERGEPRPRTMVFALVMRIVVVQL